MHEVRSVPEKCVALCRQCPKSTEIESLKAAHSSVNYAQGVAGTAGCEVTLLHQGHGETAKRGVRATEIPAMPPPTTIKSNSWDANTWRSLFTLLP